jgi:hypothetical protein
MHNALDDQLWLRIMRLAYYYPGIDVAPIEVINLT